MNANDVGSDQALRELQEAPCEELCSSPAKVPFKDDTIRHRTWPGNLFLDFSWFSRGFVRHRETANYVLMSRDSCRAMGFKFTSSLLTGHWFKLTPGLQVIIHFRFLKMSRQMALQLLLQLANWNPLFSWRCNNPGKIQVYLCDWVEKGTCLVLELVMLHNTVQLSWKYSQLLCESQRGHCQLPEPSDSQLGMTGSG